MNDSQMSSLIDRLNQLPNPYDIIDWEEYRNFNFAPEDISIFGQLFKERALNEPECYNRIIHSWRILAIHGGPQAVHTLIRYFLDISEDYSDWETDEFPEVFGRIGAEILPELHRLVQDQKLTEISHITAACAYPKLVEFYPELREQVVQINTDLLEKANLGAMLNGFLVSNLIDLKATESINTIRQAIKLNLVDTGVAGDMEDVEIELGLRTKRVSPRPNFQYVNTTESFQSPIRKEKIGRNDPCPCGSGKKYKKCCGSLA